MRKNKLWKSLKSRISFKDFYTCKMKKLEFMRPHELSKNLEVRKPASALKIFERINE